MARLRYKIAGTVSGGKFTPASRERFVSAFRQFEGKECEVIVQPVPKKRSNNQNAYMWGVVYSTLADWSGQDVNDIHDALCAMFAPPRVVKTKFTGSVVVQGRTSTMSTAEIEEYLTKIRVWALSEHGVNIPLPNEVDYE